jgi:RNA polymerase sigma-54 factor
MHSQRTVLRQELRQKMSTQLLQSINLLALPITELRQQIQEELERNPALEIASDPTKVSLEELRPMKATDRNLFENSSDPGYSPSFNTGEDNKRMFMEGALSKAENLHDHLMWQLRLQPLNEEEKRVGELLIMNLDNNGFYIEPLDQLLKTKDKAYLDKLLPIIRSFDPIGTCTENYSESLAVQMDLLEDFPYDAQKIVLDCFDLLEKGEYKKIGKKIGLTESDVIELLEDIKRLNPFPGREFLVEQSQYVVPDVLIKKRDGEFVLVINDEEIPVLRVEPFFEEQSDSEELTDAAAQKFIKKSVKDARWFLQSLDHRRSTLSRVSKAITEFQRDFFHRGAKYLKPLTLKDIANELDLSEATISRITTNKYIQTEWGNYPLKYFFTNSISGSGSSGSQYSKEGVKEIIKEIIQGWDEKKKLSDQRISDLLKQRGIEIARRTVAKYKKELQDSNQI